MSINVVENTLKVKQIELLQTLLNARSLKIGHILREKQDD